jgi:hypothetical protein
LSASLQLGYHCQSLTDAEVQVQVVHHRCQTHHHVRVVQFPAHDHRTPVHDQCDGVQLHGCQRVPVVLEQVSDLDVKFVV